MTAPMQGLIDSASVRRWALFFIKAAALIGLLALFAKWSPSMPVFCVALIWAVLSAACAVGAAYHSAIKKTSRQHEYQDGGALARLHAGRIAMKIRRAHV